MVDIARDFLGVHGLLQSMTQRYALGTVVFEDVQKFVGDDSSSVLFRLKESCHSLFRPSGSEGRVEVGAGALLDLVVGSLFHEAMALRENLYQLESYGAKVRTLHGEPRAVTDELIQEFEKIHAASSKRLDEAVTEIEALLGQARRQFLHVLVEYKEEGLLARCLWEHADDVASTFGQDLVDLFAEIHGESISALLLIADSYLDSAYYEDALLVLEQARLLASTEGVVDERIHYATGMRSFMQRDYEACIRGLTEWWSLTRHEEVGVNRVTLAIEAVAHVESIGVEENGPDPAVATLGSGALMEQLRSFSS